VGKEMSRQTPYARRDQFRRCIPKALKYKTLLYVGANVKRMQMIEHFQEAKYKIDAVEAWPKNVAALKAWNKKHGVFAKIYQADIRNFAIAKRYDVVMWWHGPEHVEISELRAILARLEWAARHFVILASPWGKYPQGAVKGNPFEEHASALAPEMWSSFGYSSDAIGIEDKPGSNLLAWKKIA
jgi:hypothetical protein